jgi:hypothetical protein
MTSPGIDTSGQCQAARDSQRRPDGIGTGDLPLHGEMPDRPGITEAAIEGATRRLRPIMMTMLVATLGLLPSAMSHAICSDSQRPFAIVTVGGLITDLLMSIFLPPTFLRLVGEADRSPAQTRRGEECGRITSGL